MMRSRDACRGVEYLAKLRARGPSFRLGEPLLKEAASVSAWLLPKTPATDSPVHEERHSAKVFRARATMYTENTAQVTHSQKAKLR